MAHGKSTRRSSSSITWSGFVMSSRRRWESPTRSGSCRTPSSSTPRESSWPRASSTPGSTWRACSRPGTAGWHRSRTFSAAPSVAWEWPSRDRRTHQGTLVDRSAGRGHRAAARATDVAPERARASGDGARRRGDDPTPSGGTRGRGAAPLGPRRLPAERRGGRSEELQLLAALRHRRLPLLVLRWLAERLSARHRDVARHLDRDVPESQRREGLHHLVQRLLRAVPLPPLQVHPYRGREAGLLDLEEQRSPLVLRHLEPRGPLLGGGRPRCRDQVVGRGLLPPHGRLRSRSSSPVLPARRGHAPERRRSTTRSTARDVIAPTGWARPGACPHSPGRSAGSFVSRVDGSSSSGCPASPRRRSTTRPWPTSSTGSSSASMGTTCRGTSFPTRRRRWGDFAPNRSPTSSASDGS